MYPPPVRKSTASKRSGSQGFGVGFDLALIHLELGERDRALDSLERGVDDHSQMQCYLNVEPALDSLRDEPRFRALSRRLGLRLTTAVCGRR